MAGSCEVCGGEHAGGLQCTAASTYTPPAVTQYDSPVGMKVGGHVIERELARGGMGVVFRATHPVIGRAVAIKVLRDELCGNAELTRRFFSEARTGAELLHRGMVEVYDLTHLPDGRPCIVMELLDGETLEARLANGPFAPRAFEPVLVALCEVLAVAHARGVVHRDIKTDNVWLQRGGGLKLLDFGIARSTLVTTATVPGLVFGTPDYMAPEQALGEVVDHRADLYAVGVVAYRALTGRLPFVAPTPAQVMVRKLVEQPLDAHELPRPLARFLTRALGREREQRFQSAAELARAFSAALVEAEAPPPAAAPPFAVKLTGRRLELTFTSKDALADVRARELAHGRLYVPTPDAVPDGALEVVARLGGEIVEQLQGEVALRPTREQAALWRVPAGVGLVVRKPAPRVERSGWTGADEQEVRSLVERVYDTHYDLLGISPDATMDTVGAAVRALARTVERLRAANPSPNQQELLQALGIKLERLRPLATVDGRAAYDAVAGNFRGVARALAAGLRVSQLDELRRDYVIRWPDRLRKAASARLAARVAVQASDVREATAALEVVLTNDPLSIDDHRQYWALAGRVARGPRVAEPLPNARAEAKPVAASARSTAGGGKGAR